MNIEHLRRWHWLLIGTAVGLLFALAPSLPSRDPDTRPPISEPDLASLLADHTPDAPTYRNLSLRPDDDDPARTFVTGECATGRGSYRPFALYTGRPFPAGDPNPAPDLQAYLDRLRATGHPVDLPNPLWTSPWFRLTWPPALGALLIGGPWPTLLRLLIGAGYGRPTPEPEYDLSRFGQHPDPAPAPPTPADTTRVTELADHLESTLAAESSPTPSPTPTPAAAPVALTGGPVVEPAPTPTDDTPRNTKANSTPSPNPPAPRRGAAQRSRRIPLLHPSPLILHPSLPPPPAPSPSSNY